MAVATNEYGLFINGETVEGSSSRDLVEPASGEPLGTAQLAGEAEIDRAVEAARGALDGDWGKTPANERSRLLHALADALAANRKELSELESRNVGKAISSTKAELFGAVENFRFYASAIGSIAGRSNPIGGSLLSYTLKEPVGVAGQIVPWNYPLLMTTWKLAPALAAGCAVVLKPDPQTPVTALRLAELAAEVGFPAGAINIVTGDGPTTGAYLVRHPGVDKVAFTGSTKTGGEIMRLCSEPIKRLTLELGGKSPNLVFADADLGSAIPSAVWSIYYAAGQSCEARSRVLVEQSIYDDFVNAFSEQAGRVKMGDPLDAETQMGSLISQAHQERVHSFVEGARGEGGEVVLGGEPGEHAFYPPTVVAGMENSSTIAQEEVFGPVVTIIPFEDEKDAVRIANDVKYGLMASVWTGDPARGHRLASRIKAGTVGINMPYTAFPGLPFGGYKQSGFGRELGIESLDLYLETKSVTVNTGLPADQPLRAVARSRYRWTVLAAGTLAQTSFAAIGVGLPAIAPAIRDTFGLSLAQVGAVLSSHWLGTLVTLLPWGFLTDRIGERVVLATGLGTCGLLLVVAGQAETFWQLYVLLFLAGAAGASVNAATGRAVMGWFDASQRGLALGIRQAAVPVGGLVGAFVLPQLTVHHAYVFLGGLCLLGAAAGAIFLREPAVLPARGRGCRVDPPRSPPLAPVRRQRPLRRGADGYSQLRRPLPPRRTLAEQGPGGCGARCRPGRGDGAAGRCRPMVGPAANAHRSPRSNRDRDERRPRRRDRLVERAAGLARPGLRRRRIADDGLERRRLRRRRRAGGPREKRFGARRPADGALPRRRRSPTRVRGRRFCRLLEPRLRAGGVVPDCRLARASDPARTGEARLS